MSCRECPRGGDTGHASILFTLLNRGSGQVDTARAHPRCPCASKTKLVTVRCPRVVLEAAAEVLVKTLRFVKSIACFRGLPPPDQLRLVRSSWAPLLVLGLVQECVDFDTVETETREPSLLHRILTHDKEMHVHAQVEEQGASVGDVEEMKEFLWKCREVKLSVTEHAFLKGAVLFNADVMDLECRDYITALQREAEHALFEHTSAVQRAAILRWLLSAVRSMNPNAVGRLFLRPTRGMGSIDEHVVTIFYES